MAIQRPGRPQTRLNQPAVNVPAKAAPAKAAPAARPATGPVQKQAAPTTRAPRAGAGSSTRSVQKQGASRPVPKQAEKSGQMMYIGIGGGALVLVLIAAFFMMGNSEKPAIHAPEKASKPKTEDVSALEEEGMKKCKAGLDLIQKHQALLSSGSMSDSQKSMLKSDLEQSRKLIGDGMGLLTKANEKSKNTYDTKQYQEALITVRKKLMELRD